MVCPAVLYYRYMRLWYLLFRTKEVQALQSSEQDLQDGDYLNVVTLPDRLDHVSLESVSESFAQALLRSSDIVLDFTRVSFVDSTGLGFLVRTLRRAEQAGKGIHMVAIGPKTRGFFELNRTWDLFRDKARDRIDDVLAYLGAQRRLPPLCYFLTRKPDFTVVDLFGRLDAQQTSGLDMAELTKSLGGRDCIVNLSQLDFVDSTGLLFFFRIQKHLAVSGKQCVLCALNDSVHRLFRLTKLHHLFRIAPDLATAEQMLKNST